jgi:predicted aldo/keto reductase-like oxidoreductase
MIEDLAIMEDLSLSPEEIRDLELGDELGLSGCYCQHCGRCLIQCPGGFDIPALMHSYMYTYGYRDLGKAYRNLDGLGPSDIKCAGCESCQVSCPLGHDVKTRILDIARLLEVPPEFVV